MADRSAAYKAAGVDIDAGNSLVSRIKSIVAGTYGKGVLSDIGGFGGLFKLEPGACAEPVLVASTDGVGTKLKLAHDFDLHDTIGIDLVAMCVNDILVQGAKPLFFLDYFATGKLTVDLAERVVTGIADGCKEAGCALLGGETAEMPGFYPDGVYDLAGFCVGLVDNARIVDGSSIGVDDVIIGIESSGPHSNGYSLIRKILAESGLGPNDPIPHSGQTVVEALLAPTRIYVKTGLNLLRDFEIKGMVPYHRRRFLRQRQPHPAQGRGRPDPFRLLEHAAGLRLAAGAGPADLAGDAPDFQLRHRLHAGRRPGDRRRRHAAPQGPA